MPQGNVAGGKKKKKGRAPKHQNSFAFKHNPGSKKTEKILSSPNTGVCRRCHDKIEWRKKYRKYKPRSQPGKCNLCCQKNIMAAYHTICTNCAGSDKAIDAMEQRRKSTAAAASAAVVVQSSDSAVDEASTTTPKEEDNDNNTAESDSQPTEEAAAAAIKRARRRLRVCAMCTSEPALSKYSNGDAEDEHLIEEIHLIEDKIEDGVADNGKKLTLREIKTLERKIEKLHSEIKERRRQRKEGNDDDDHDDDSEEQDEASGGEDNDSDQFDEEDEDEANDPFLLAVGGKDKLLVGEEYQKMLLARETR